VNDQTQRPAIAKFGRRMVREESKPWISQRSAEDFS
jgi:hypothetical protein